MHKKKRHFLPVVAAVLIPVIFMNMFMPAYCAFASDTEYEDTSAAYDESLGNEDGDSGQENIQIEEQAERTEENSGSADEDKTADICDSDMADKVDDTAHIDSTADSTEEQSAFAEDDADSQYETAEVSASRDFRGGGVTVDVSGEFRRGSELTISEQEPPEQNGVSGEMLAYFAVSIKGGEEISGENPVRARVSGNFDSTEYLHIYVMEDGEYKETDSGDITADKESIEFYIESQFPVMITEDLPKTDGTPEAAEADADNIEHGYREFSISSSPAPRSGSKKKSVRGNTCSITVIGKMPEGARLSSEDMLSEYADGKHMDVPEGGSVVAAYDITVYDGDVRFEPGKESPLLVEITGLKISGDRELSVWHIKDTGESEQVSDLTVDSGSISFMAESFSVYAVVEGPEPYEPQPECADGMDSLLSEDAQGGFLMSVTRGTSSDYYFQNTVETAQKVFNTTTDAHAASVWYFEKADSGENMYRVFTILDNGDRKYIANTGGNYAGLTDNGSLFEVSCPGPGVFYLKLNGSDKYLQYSNGGKGIRFYDGTGTAGNSQIKLTFADSMAAPNDVYGLDMKSYGIMNYSDGVSGRAMESGLSSGALSSRSMAVRPDTVNGNGMVYVSRDSDITMWTFHSAGEDRYSLSAYVDGEEKYLYSDGNTLSFADADSATGFTIIPGTGDKAGKIQVSLGGKSIAFSNKTFKLARSGTDDSQWMNLVDRSEMNDDDFVVYAAKKVSVSDTENIQNGTRVVIYTRVWDDDLKKYRYYAVDHDGSLVQCYESGDCIEWIGNKINTFLWGFTEYYWEGTDSPNYYYDLKNQYSKKYIAPTINGEFLSDSAVGLNLRGRQYGDYYSGIIAWDDPYYAYAGIKVSEDGIVSCPIAESEDFYFAVMQEQPDTDALTEVPTVDNTPYGIKMKLIDFGNSNTRQNQFLNSSAGGMNAPPTQGLLSTDLGGDGYPVAHGGSLGNLFSGARDVNHLFINSTFSGTGYFEFDSAQNFASVQNDGTFAVYKELGTTDSSEKPSLKHGQFFPYDTLNPARMASVNGENLYDAVLNPLNDNDPRKYEQMYLVSRPDYYFGMELEASFVQTPSGRDAWGHDIIYEFTGDDDFWLYVDGELVIDLGGIHSALPGNVNFCTGEVNVNGTRTTLREVFEGNYITRGFTAEEAAAKADELFTLNDYGQYVFNDYSTHTMRIFFMERGAGASNLHMRFNLSSVKQGQVLLSKKISGTEKQDYKLAEYAYQVWYRREGSEEYTLLKATDDYDKPTAVYQNTKVPVKHRNRFRTPGGSVEYRNVFFLTPGQTAAITMPDDTVDYRITECGVNTQVYDAVTANGTELTGAATADASRQDFTTPVMVVDKTQNVIFDNHVNESAKRTLTITKRLYDAGGSEITDDTTGFNFRLYLCGENDSEPQAVEMQEYMVKDSGGYYCVWDPQNASFVPTGKNDYAQLTAEEKTALTFHTSINGAISKIPAGFRVEVRDLLVGTRFRIEEKENEIPDGYTLIGYERDEASYIVEDGDTVNSGIIRDNDSPSVEVHNRRGFGLTAKKEWSDADFMDSHGDIFVAVCLNGSIVDGTVRRIRHPGTSVYYYRDSLEDGTELSDYEIREVVIDGDYTVDENGAADVPEGSVRILDSGDTLAVSAEQDGTASSYEYTVSYEKGQSAGYAENARTDVISNGRKGIRLIKQDWNGNPVPDAVFSVRRTDGDDSGSTFTSGEDGVITTVYMNRGDSYTVSEVSAPSGYCTGNGDILLTTDADGTVTAAGGDYVQAVPDGSGGTLVIIKNRAVILDAVNVGIDRSGTENPLSGSLFSLHKGVDGGSGTVMDYTPIPGFEELCSADVTALIAGIDQSLGKGTYYLRQNSVSEGYERINEPIEFMIGEDGHVSLSESYYARLEKTEEDGVVHYTIVVINRMRSVTPTGFDTQEHIILLIAVCVTAVLSAFIALHRRQKE